MSTLETPVGSRDNRDPESSYRRFLLRRAHGVIDAHLETRDRADFARSVKSMTDHTAHEYGGRFLIELLQNGYDAHPADRHDGRITILLDETEGEHGVLYVGNAGRPFTESNVRAICNLGLSTAVWKFVRGGVVAGPGVFL